MANGRIEREAPCSDFDIATLRDMGAAACDRELRRLRRKRRMIDAGIVLLMFSALVLVIYGIALAIDKGF